MDAYDATKVVYSRVQAMEPDHASKIMGYLLLQDEGEQEMFRLAFSHDSILQAVILKSKAELGLLLTSSSASSQSSYGNPNSSMNNSSLLSSSSSIFVFFGSGLSIIRNRRPRSHPKPREAQISRDESIVVEA